MYFEEIDNLFVTSIDKNFRPFDAMTIGHFLMGTVGFVIFYLFLNPFLSFVVVSILGALFEPFEYLLFKFTNFTNIRFKFYRRYYPSYPFSLETEKNKMECFSNIIIDIIFVSLGALFCFLVLDLIMNIILNIFFCILFFFAKKKVLDRILA